MGFAPAGRLAQFLIRFGSWSHPVIASEAKQSLADSGSSARDCFVARCAPRNDGVDGPLTASMCQSWVSDNANDRSHP